MLPEVDETTALVGKGSTKNSNVFLHVGVPAIFTYFAGVLCLSYIEGWPLITSSYVITQIVTTIGYGDLTVETDLAKVFMAIYSLTVLVLMAYAYNTLVGKLVDWECEILRAHFRKLEMYEGAATTDKEAEKKFGGMNKVFATGFVFLQVLLFGMIFFRLYENCTCSYGVGQVKGCDSTTLETCIATGGYVKTWADCFYMSSITLVTIGFGDFQPRTRLGRVVGIFWMLVGVVATGSFLSALAGWLFESDKKHIYTQSDAIAGITEQSFKKIDRDKDGFLSRGEFLAFTLHRYGLVSDELIEEIWKQYDRLDVQGNNKVTLDVIQQRQDSVRRSISKDKTVDQLSGKISKHKTEKESTAGV